MRTSRIEAAVVTIMRKHTTKELAVMALRYEALRKLDSRQYAALCKRNLNGERFDDMVDDLVFAEIVSFLNQD